jgi:hypothetical protein
MMNTQPINMTIWQDSNCAVNLRRQPGSDLITLIITSGQDVAYLRAMSPVMVDRIITGLRQFTAEAVHDYESTTAY